MVEFDNALNASKAELAEPVGAKKEFLSESSLRGPVSHTIGDSAATIAALVGMILSECRRAVDAVVDGRVQARDYAELAGMLASIVVVAHIPKAVINGYKLRFPGNS